jgi:hypothetical protein
MLLHFIIAKQCGSPGGLCVDSLRIWHIFCLQRWTTSLFAIRCPDTDRSPETCPKVASSTLGTSLPRSQSIKFWPIKAYRLFSHLCEIWLHWDGK